MKDNNPLVSKKTRDKGLSVAFVGSMLVFVKPSWQKNKTIINRELKVNPNGPCPCGSGKIRKKCCHNKKKRKWWEK